MGFRSLAIFLFAAFLSLTSAQTQSAEPLVVIHPAPESKLDKRYDYYWELLRAALEETRDEGPYILRQSTQQMSEKRLLSELSKGTGHLNIIRENYDPEMEDRFLPIKIPLLKGALGWRVFLIRQDRQTEFSKINSLEDLKKLRIGAGAGWGNIPILEHNGLQVSVGSDYEGLFKMLMANRFDLFSRGIMEAPIELEVRRAKFPNMTIENNLVLRYFLLDFFFVNKKDKIIAERVERGLNKIIANGIFDKIFDKYYWKSIESLKLDDRLIIDIDNPNKGKGMPPEDREALWLEAFIKKKKSEASFE